MRESQQQALFATRAKRAAEEKEPNKDEIQRKKNRKWWNRAGSIRKGKSWITTIFRLQ